MLGITLGGGCAATGSMTGLLADPGQPARSVTLSYRMDRAGDRGYLSTTMPGGEAFNGPLARISPGATAPPGLDIDFSVVDWGFTADTWTFGPTDSDKAVALLQGNRGSKIRCRFTLLYPDGGISSGGTGQCEVTSGEKIDVKF
jgi:hypothetical protein